MATLKGLWYVSKKVLVSAASFVAMSAEMRMARRCGPRDLNCQSTLEKTLSTLRILAVVLVQGVEDGGEIEPFVGVASFTQLGAGWQGVERKVCRRAEEGD